MTSTKQWAAAHGVCVEDTVPPVDDYDEPYIPRTVMTGSFNGKPQATAF